MYIFRVPYRFTVYTVYRAVYIEFLFGFTVYIKFLFGFTVYIKFLFGFTVYTGLLLGFTVYIELLFGFTVYIELLFGFTVYIESVTFVSKPGMFEQVLVNIVHTLVFYVSIYLPIYL